MARKSTEPRELPRAAETLRLLDELEAKGLTEAMFELQASSQPGEADREAAIDEALRRVPLVRGRT